MKIEEKINLFRVLVFWLVMAAIVLVGAYLVGESIKEKQIFYEEKQIFYEETCPLLNASSLNGTNIEPFCYIESNQIVKLYNIYKINGEYKLKEYVP